MPNLDHDEKPAQIAYSVSEAAELLGLGRVKAYRLVKDGVIPSTRIAGRLVVLRETLAGLIEPRE